MPTTTKRDPLSATARKDAARAATKRSVDRELMLVSVLSRLWPAHLHYPRVRQALFPYIVCIHSPAGQLVWRVSDEEMPLFAHLALSEADTPDYQAGDKEAILLLLATEGWS